MFINLLQTFGRIPNYLHHCQFQEEAPDKETYTEVNLFKPKGRYIKEPERNALLKVIIYSYNIFECQEPGQLSRYSDRLWTGWPGSIPGRSKRSFSGGKACEV
jgi:hypothetical protein